MFAEAEMDGETEAIPIRSAVLRAVLAITGLGLVGTAVAAIFVTDNGSGSAALVALGGTLIVLAVLWNQVQSVEFGGVKWTFKVATQLLRGAEIAEAHGETELAARLRSEARALAEHARPIASSYERLRRSLPKSAHRTVALEGLIGEASSAAPNLPYSGADVARLFYNGTPGERIYALGLMQGAERFRDLNVVLEAIERSASAFEQYHALRVAAQLAPTLTAAEKQRLRDAIEKQLRPRFAPSSDRGQVATRILVDLEEDRADEA